jgi:DNA polymerase-1
VREWIDRSVKQAEETERVHTMSGRVRFFPEIKGPGNAAAAAKRAAINTIVQGGSADIIKEAMLKIYPCLGTYGARMLLQIHDELLFEVPQANAAEFSAAARQVMEHAVVLKVPLTVTIKRGRNWQDMEAMPR